MAYFEGRSVTITSPVAARVLELALSAWVGDKREPPSEIRLLVTELHMLASGTASRHTAEPQRDSGTLQKLGSVTMTVVEATEVLGISESMVRRRCRDKTLLAVQMHGSYVIDAASVEDLRVERELKSA